MRTGPGEEEFSKWLIKLDNSESPPGMPPHKFKLKIGAIVMLLRNLNVHQ
ncbi:unnamed protein product, partial [Rotaria sp. Silwood1]